MTILVVGPALSSEIYYRCEWDSTVVCIYVEHEERTLYVPGFEYARAKKEITGVKVEKLDDPAKLLEQLQGPFEVNWDFPHRIAKQLNGEIVPKKTLFEEQSIKTEQEIQHISEAQELAKKTCDLIEKQLSQVTIQDSQATLYNEPLTSEELQVLARTYLLQHDADCPEIIVSSGEQTGQPHNRGSGIIQEGPIIIDIFPKAHSKYHGDLTRTIILGEHEQARKQLQAVREVHDLCVQKCVPGQHIGELHTFAEEELAKRGFRTDEERTEGFIHSLGHGVGLDIHEEPNIGPKNTQVLKKGMVITIEPGIYYDVGVRWENIVLVDDTPRIL